ncbi:uncharacterized protein [Phaseolus vulgaris]|uniref:uncharacterized protein isoform X2 n=1 Tax=Phaseolus vulgaris TaxID=3885 RepID=UPI0035CA7202
MENLKEICCGPLPFQLLMSLKSFILYDCIHLEGMLFKSKISLCNLKKLSIRKCPMLTSLFELSTTQSLLLLEELEIQDCEQLKSIVKDENKRKEDSGEEIVDAHNHSKSFTLTFPNLKTLIIYKCPQLLFILPVVVARNVPKLVRMIIRECNLLKYVFGPYQHKHEEEDLHHESKDVIFTILSEVYLVDLPNFVDIYPECEEFKCLSVRISSSRYESKAQVESNPMKCKILHWIHKYRNKWRTTKIPLDSKDQLQDCSLSMVNDSSANDVIGQEMTVNLEKNALNYMPQTHVGSKSFFTLQNVTVLSIEECKKIEVIFCASMLEGLPYMHKLAIFRCNELKQIISEDTKNQTKPFFPRLKVLVIVGCNKLKCVFPISTSKMLSELEVLVIVEACMLEQVFQGDTDQRAEIPNMKTLVFVELPRLCQEIEFFTVKDCCVKNCPKLSLSSSLQSFKDIINSITEISDVILILHQALHDKFYEDNQHEHDFESNELEDVVKQNEERIEEEQEIVEKASGLGIPSMAISPTDTALDKRQSLENEEGQMVIPSSNLNMEPLITKDVNYEAFHGTSNSVATQAKSTNPPGSKLRNQLIENTLQEMSNDVYEDSKGRVISNQNEMAKATEDFPIGNKVEVASGTELNSLQEHGEGQIFVPFSIVNIELETTKDVGVGDIQESSMSTVAPFDTTNSPEKLSHVSEDSSFACTTITKELEQLVCNKHLGLENLGLLSNFLVKHPCVGLMGNTVSDRYKGFAYTCLANLLKFLQSHSILDVLGSNQSEFIELLQDLRNLGFNKDWLDDLERLREL